MVEFMGIVIPEEEYKEMEKMSLSENFNRKEFECSCGCGFDTVDYELLMVLEDLRSFYENPIIINSACRCESHNKKIGGVSNSQHLTGKAADIIIKNTYPEFVYQYLDNKYNNKYGIGNYGTFTHIDVRSEKARW